MCDRLDFVSTKKLELCGFVMLFALIPNRIVKLPPPTEYYKDGGNIADASMGLFQSAFGLA
jgi:hypothetical protein